MDYEFLIKLIAVPVGSFSVGKILYDVMTGKRSRMREEYNFAKVFFGDISSEKPLHPFLREKGYQAIAGKNHLSAVEIEYLLSLEGPVRALRDFSLGRPYLDHLPERGNLEIAFREKYQNPWARKLRRFLYLALYFVLFFFILAPLLFYRILFSGGISPFAMFIITMAVFGPCAWLCLQEATRIYRAEKLVQYQHKHTQNILMVGNNFLTKR